MGWGTILHNVSYKTHVCTRIPCIQYVCACARARVCVCTCVCVCVYVHVCVSVYYMNWQVLGLKYVFNYLCIPHQYYLGTWILTHWLVHKSWWDGCSWQQHHPTITRNSIKYHIFKELKLINLCKWYCTLCCEWIIITQVTYIEFLYQIQTSNKRFWFWSQDPLAGEVLIRCISESADIRHRASTIINDTIVLSLPNITIIAIIE